MNIAEKAACAATHKISMENYHRLSALEQREAKRKRKIKAMDKAVGFFGLFLVSCVLAVGQATAYTEVVSSTVASVSTMFAALVFALVSMVCFGFFLVCASDAFE